MTAILRDERIYRQAMAIGPAFIAAKVEEHGSIDGATAAIGVERDVIAAGLALHAAAPEADPTKPKEPASGLTIAKDIFGLFAGIAVLIYVLGGVVLFARLSFSDLPNEAVFAQLPREFLITIGIGQVLIPACGVMAAHALARLLWLRAEADNRYPVVTAGVAWLISMAVIVYAATRSGGPGDPFAGDPGFWLATAGLLAVAIALVLVLRHFHAIGRLPGRLQQTWLTLTFAYGLVAMIVATAVAATFPLLEARACFSAGFAENGLLVGQGTQRVFLGELRPSNPRIVSLPASEIEELFIGHRSDGESAGPLLAGCDPRGPTAVVTSMREVPKGRSARKDAAKQIRAIRDASTVDAALLPAEALSAAALKTGRAARTVADVADSINDAFQADDLGEGARGVNAAGEAVVRAALRLQYAVESTQRREGPSLVRYRRLAESAWRRTKLAMREVRRLGRHVRRVVSAGPAN